METKFGKTIGNKYIQYSYGETIGRYVEVVGFSEKKVRVKPLAFYMVSTGVLGRDIIDGKPYSVYARSLQKFESN